MPAYRSRRRFALGHRPQQPADQVGIARPVEVDVGDRDRVVDVQIAFRNRHDNRRIGRSDSGSDPILTKSGVEWWQFPIGSKAMKKTLRLASVISPGFTIVTSSGDNSLKRSVFYPRRPDRSRHHDTRHRARARPAHRGGRPRSTRVHRRERPAPGLRGRKPKGTCETAKRAKARGLYQRGQYWLDCDRRTDGSRRRQRWSRRS